MDAGKKREYELLELIRTGKPMTWSERLDLIVRLSIPSILAQLSVIVMLYIDASMVGSLGANASASIGLVSTTTWLFSGVCTAAATGFSVQVAHLIGANDPAGARNVLRQAFSATLLFGLFASAVGCAVSRVAARMARRERRHRPGCFALFPDLCAVTPVPAGQLPVGQHAAVQR